MRREVAINLVRDELEKATSEWGCMASYHEGYAVIKEELDELWSEIKGKQKKENLEKEAVQIAAMAIRFLLDLIPDPLEYAGKDE